MRDKTQSWGLHSRATSNARKERTRWLKFCFQKYVFRNHSVFFFLQIFPPVCNTPDRTNPARINWHKAEAGRFFKAHKRGRVLGAVVDPRVWGCPFKTQGGIFYRWNNCEGMWGPPKAPAPGSTRPQSPRSHRHLRAWRIPGLTEALGKDTFTSQSMAGTTSSPPGVLGFASLSPPSRPLRNPIPFPSFPALSLPKLPAPSLAAPGLEPLCSHLRADDRRKATVAAAVAAGGQRA